MGSVLVSGAPPRSTSIASCSRAGSSVPGQARPGRGRRRPAAAVEVALLAGGGPPTAGRPLQPQRAQPAGALDAHVQVRRRPRTRRCPARSGRRTESGRRRSRRHARRARADRRAPCSARVSAPDPRQRSRHGSRRPNVAERFALAATAAASRPIARPDQCARLGAALGRRPTGALAAVARCAHGRPSRGAIGGAGRRAAWARRRPGTPLGSRAPVSSASVGSPARTRCSAGLDTPALQHHRRAWSGAAWAAPG